MRHVLKVLGAIGVALICAAAFWWAVWELAKVIRQ